MEFTKRNILLLFAVIAFILGIVAGIVAILSRPQSGRLVGLVSLERYDIEQPYINLAEIKIYDETGAPLPASRFTGSLLSPAFNNSGSFPIGNLFDGNTSNFAQTASTYFLSGPAINNGTAIPVQHVDYLPEIKDNVFMAIDGGLLKMTNSKSTISKWTTVPAGKTASEVWDPTKWNTYTNNTNNNVSAYPLSVSTPTATPLSNLDFRPPINYMQIRISPPSKVSKIEIFNRSDGSQDRIDGLIVKTFDPNYNIISKTRKITGSNMKYTIQYNQLTGEVAGMYST